MSYKRQSQLPCVLTLTLILFVTAASTRLRADTGPCGGASVTIPFTDVASSNIFFCSIAAAYFSGLTNGTTPTTYSPSASVTREQMAAFITRTQESALRRGSRRAALKQWASPKFASGGMTTVGDEPVWVESDGADLWVANFTDDSISRVRASDGKLLETWTNASSPYAMVVSRGRIFITADTNPGMVFRIDPKQPAGDVAVLSSNDGSFTKGITTDGESIWTANHGGSVSKIDPGTGNVSLNSSGFDQPIGILYDGASIWVTDEAANTLLKVNDNGTIAQTVAVGNRPGHPLFDGTNIWVPNYNSDTVTVVRASTGAIVATLSGNGLNSPFAVAFDGQRILITTDFSDRVCLWNAADLTPMGAFDPGTGAISRGACSDGINFWITLTGTNKLARF